MADTKVYAGKYGIQKLWRRIKAEIGKFTAFEKKPAAPDGTPDVPVDDRKTNIIYLVEEDGATPPDMCKEWIWTLPEEGEGEWVCIGDTSVDLSRYALKAEMAVIEGTGVDSDKTTITLKDGTSATVLNAHQDISGKADRATTLAGYGIIDASISGTTVTLGNETAETLPDRGSEQKAGDILTLDSSRNVLWTNDEFITIDINEPPEEPLENFFQFTNVGESPVALTINSSTDGIAYVNAGLFKRFTAGSASTLSLPPNSAVKIAGLNGPESLSSDAGALSLDRFDESLADMTSLFKGLTALESIPQWNNVTQVTSLKMAFMNCTSLKSIPDSWIVSGTSSFKYNVDCTQMFSGCSSLVTGGSTGFDYIYPSNMSGMFENCSAWKGDAYKFYTTKASRTHDTRTFYNCANAIKYKYIPTDWGGLGWSTAQYIVKNVDAEYSNEYMPFNGGYKYSLSQSLYKSDDLTRAQVPNEGDIIALEFYQVTDRSYTRNSVDIYLVRTTDTTMSTSSIQVNEDSKYYSGKVSGSKGWIKITLDRPFAYSNSEGFYLIVNDNSGTYLTNNAPVFKYMTYTANRGGYLYSDNSNYDPTSRSYNLTSGSQSFVRDLRLTIGSLPTN